MAEMTLADELRREADLLHRKVIAAYAKSRGPMSLEEAAAVCKMMPPDPDYTK